ncbi:MAG: hypothetical protein GX167_08765 [Firmicutes bacterium]|nr:hypothetical protein [Bacillota bacterium]
MQKKLQIVLVMLVVIVLGTVSMRTWYGGKADRSDTSLPAGHIAAVAAMQKNKADTKEPAYAETKTGEETQKGQIARTAEDIEKQIKKEQLAR